MNTINFEEMVSSLVKPGQDVLNSLTPEKADLLHMAIALPGEVGELIDALKKFIIYEKELDRDHKGPFDAQASSNKKVNCWNT